MEGKEITEKANDYSYGLNHGLFLTSTGISTHSAVVNGFVAGYNSSETDNSKAIATLHSELEKARELLKNYQDREQVLGRQLDDYLVENHEMKKTLLAAKRTIEKLVVWADIASEDRKQFYEVIDKTLSNYNGNEKNKLTTFLSEGKK